MKKKLISLLLCAVLMLSVLAGCGSGNTASTGETTAGGTKAEEKTESTTETATDTKSSDDFDLLIGVSIRSLDNEYYVFVSQGIEAFAEQLREETGMKVEVQTLLCEYSNDQQINDIKSLISKGGDRCIIYVDPNDTSICGTIAELCEEAGIYWGSAWSFQDGVIPTDYDYYVYYQTPGIEESMEELCLDLFASFKTPNTGKILAIQGNMATTAGVARFHGLELALEKTSGVELVDAQDCNFEVAKTQECLTTWLSMYDFDEIDAVWVDNDENAMAAIEVLASRGYDGKVVTTGFDGTSTAAAAISKGTMFGSVCSNAQLQGGLGCSYLYAVWNGDVDLSTVPADERAFYTITSVITPENIDSYISDYIDAGAPDIDWMDYKQLILSGYDVN